MLHGLTGNFFSGPDAEEVIVQAADGEAAAERRSTARFPARQGNHFAIRAAGPLPSQQAESDAPNQAVGPDEEAMGYSIMPSEKKFRVAGVTPASDSGGGPVGFNNAGMYLPLAVAENLQVVQGADLREMSRSLGAGRRGALCCVECPRV